jgi:DNA-binding transcriptional LysR family regulator
MSKAIGWENRIGCRLRLRDLHFLFTVVQSGSMGKAAAQLGVSQPVVSEAIADLEATIGVRLLDRSPRGVEPTLYGRALLKRGQVAFDELRQGIKDIEFLADPAEGEVRIGCSESISAGFLPPVVERMSRQYPRLVFHVAQVNTLSPLLEFPELRERKLDLILARLVKPFGEFQFDDDLRVEHVFDDTLVVVAGAQSRWATRRKIDLAELADEPWILPPGSWNNLVVEEAFRAIGLKMPKICVETFSVALRNQLLVGGRHIAAIPGSMLLAKTKSLSVKVLPIALPKRPWPVAIVTLKNRTLSPVAELFIKHAREIAKSMAAKATSNSPLAV